MGFIFDKRYVFIKWIFLFFWFVRFHHIKNFILIFKFQFIFNQFYFIVVRSSLDELKLFFLSNFNFDVNFGCVVEKDFLFQALRNLWEFFETFHPILFSDEKALKITSWFIYKLSSLVKWNPICPNYALVKILKTILLTIVYFKANHNNSFVDELDHVELFKFINYDWILFFKKWF